MMDHHHQEEVLHQGEAPLPLQEEVPLPLQEEVLHLQGVMRHPEEMGEEHGGGEKVLLQREALLLGVDLHPDVEEIVLRQEEDPHQEGTWGIRMEVAPGGLVQGMNHSLEVGIGEPQGAVEEILGREEVLHPGAEVLHPGEALPQGETLAAMMTVEDLPVVHLLNVVKEVEHGVEVVTGLLLGEHLHPDVDLHQEEALLPDVALLLAEEAVTMDLPNGADLLQQLLLLLLPVTNLLPNPPLNLPENRKVTAGQLSSVNNSATWDWPDSLSHVRLSGICCAGV